MAKTLLNIVSSLTLICFLLCLQSTEVAGRRYEQSEWGRAPTSKRIAGADEEQWEGTEYMEEGDGRMLGGATSGQ